VADVSVTYQQYLWCIMAGKVLVVFLGKGYLGRWFILFATRAGFTRLAYHLNFPAKSLVTF
jgi:hypothetical protein